MHQVLLNKSDGNRSKLQLKFYEKITIKKYKRYDTYIASNSWHAGRNSVEKVDTEIRNLVIKCVLPASKEIKFIIKSHLHKSFAEIRMKIKKKQFLPIFFVV